ncbi:MAG TPA: hypothetical protein VFN08_08360 [Gemmatimonadales bacterium]|jgi:hypothetical protein|nr:hypothetical protein [Gemmatimonadales bacterium]
MLLSAAYAGALTAQAKPAAGIEVCALASDEEFQKAQGIDPRIGYIPSTPEKTEMTWGPHCDYSGGSIDLFTRKSPSAELDRVLALTKGGKQRVPVSGLGDRAFFTTVYPEDQYRRRGFLAVFAGPHLVTFSMDPEGEETLEATRPKLESLAKLVLPRLK